MKIKVSFFLAWYDFWIGLFYDRHKRVLYFCPLPCVVFKFAFGEQGPTDYEVALQDFKQQEERVEDRLQQRRVNRGL